MGNLYSTEKIMLYVGDSESQCKDMLKLFIQTIPPELQKLEDMLRINDYDKAYEVSHRIKPSFEILQIEEGTNEFLELHAKLNSKIDLDSVILLLEDIKSRTFKAISEIKKDFKI